MTRKEHIIQNYQLIPHPEGGFFREVYRSGAQAMASKGDTDSSGVTVDFPDRGIRNVMTSIYWMLTPEAPFGCWIKNASDHIHYHLDGASITYYVIDKNGVLSKHVLGKNLEKGEQMQLVVEGGCWKASEMEKNGDFALIAEGVAPGFDYHDLEAGTASVFQKEYPEAFRLCKHLLRPEELEDFEQAY